MRIKKLKIRTRIGKGHDHITRFSIPVTKKHSRFKKKNCRKIEYLSGPKLTLNFVFLRD